MPVERNGIVIFDLDEKYPEHPAFKALQGVSLGDVRFPFGFFLVQHNGKTIVVPGTEEDRRQRLLRAFPNTPPEVLSATCHPSVWHERCEGGCPVPTYRCMRIYDDPFHYFACACVDIS